jgi:RNA polymerase sigma-70 factor (ECF subfamily)
MVSFFLHESAFLPDIGSTRPQVETLGVALNDAALVDAARSGSREAEEQLYLRHVHYIQGLLFRLLGNRGDAEDALQETFVIALDQLASLRDAAAFRSWLAQIAVSLARRRFRKARLLRALGLHRSGDDVGLEMIPAPHAPAAVHADFATLVQLVARLASDERVAWLLRYVDGESLAEVADHCRCSLATAKRRIAAANAYIQSELGEPTGEPR